MPRKTLGLPAIVRSPDAFISGITRRALLASAVASGISSAHAQSYPTRTVTVIPLLAAGTGLDVTTRLYAEQLSQSLGKPFVVENKAGSAGLLGISALKAAPADGHTLMVATSAAMVIRPALAAHLSYDPLKDFVPVALYVKSPYILVIDPKLPVHSVTELIKYIKDRPGQLSFSSPGTGGAQHLSAAYMSQKFGLDAAHVPYRNSTQAITDVGAGHVSMAFAEAGASLPLIREGKLRALAVTSSTRLPTVPELAPFRETDGASDFEAVSWHVLVAKTGTPPEIVDKLHGEMKRIMEEPGMRRKVADIGLLPIDVVSVEETRNYIAAEREKWGGLVRKLGLEGSQ